MPTSRELQDAIDALNDLLDVTWKKGLRAAKDVSDDLDSAHAAFALGAATGNVVAQLRTVAKSKWLRDVRNSALSERQAKALAAAESALAKALAPQATVSAEGQ